MRAAVPRGLALLPGLLSVLLASQAVAHGDYDWIMKYRDSRGMSCCGPEDCRPVPAEDVRARPGGWLVTEPFGGAAVSVPFDAALDSEDEHFWFCKNSDGSLRCLFAPSAGT